MKCLIVKKTNKLIICVPCDLRFSRIYIGCRKKRKVERTKFLFQVVLFSMPLLSNFMFFKYFIIGGPVDFFVIKLSDQV